MVIQPRGFKMEQFIGFLLMKVYDRGKHVSHKKEVQDEE